MTLSFDGRVALVTGAGGGLGRAYAEEFARRGASVVVNDLGGSVDGAGASTGPAQTAADAINAAGGTAVADTNSVASAEGAEAMVQTALDNFGRIDIVVNNAGILRDEAFHKLTPEGWERVLGVHLNGTMQVSRAAIPRMREQGYGRIVNTTSAAGLFGNFGQASYGAAKMGIVGLTRVLAVEGASKGIRVNAVGPGALTRMTEEAMAEVKDLVSSGPDMVAPVVMYLAHDECDLNGEVISAAFGRVARIAIGTTPGYFNRELTPEDVQENLVAIMDDAGMVFPKSFPDELKLIMAHYRTAAAPA